MQRGEVHGTADEDAEDEDDRDVRVRPAFVWPNVDGIHRNEGAHQQHLREDNKNTKWEARITMAVKFENTPVHTGEAMMAMAYCAVSGPYSLSRLVFWIRTK